MTYESEQDKPLRNVSPDEQVQLYNLVQPLISAYLAEIRSEITIDAYLKEFAIIPIVIEEKLMGFWGVKLQALNPPRRLATIKAFYLQREYRGRFINQAADILVRGLSKQGITELEIWAFPGVQRWLERRYGIKPNIFVTYNPIETFKVYKE
jgi:hypothetical protein